MHVEFDERDIAQRKAFMESVFALKNNRPGLLYQIEVKTGDFGVDDVLLHKELMLLCQLKEFEKRSFIHDDYVPALHTDLGTAIFPSAFGAKVDFFPHTMPWAHPVISNPEEASLLSYNVRAELLNRVLEYTTYFQEATHYRFPIRVTDIQGPLDVAYLVWNNQDFMYAMYTHSKEVHSLLQKATDLIINFVKTQRSTVKTEFVPLHFPRLYMPEGLGIGVSEDASAFIGPKQYEEYALPYLNALSEEFGGIFIHSCGNFSHNLENIAKIHNLRGLDFGITEIPFDNVLKVFNNKVVLSVRAGLNKEFNPFRDYLEFVDFVLDRKPDPRGLVIQIWQVATEENLEIAWKDDYYQQVEKRIYCEG